MKKTRQRKVVTNNVRGKRNIFSKRHAHILKDLLLTVIVKKVIN